jgi:uncharacterized protein (DUF983 family)
MPGNLVHCRTCRALLNTDLVADSVEIPEFIPLPEIEAMVEVELMGYYLACPHCKRELRVNAKYLDEKVQCKFCDSQFTMDFSNPKLSMEAFYCTCPHCQEELRAAPKYMGMKVACKHCGGKIHFVEHAK